MSIIKIETSDQPLHTLALWMINFAAGFRCVALGLADLLDGSIAISTLGIVTSEFRRVVFDFLYKEAMKDAEI